MYQNQRETGWAVPNSISTPKTFNELQVWLHWLRILLPYEHMRMMIHSIHTPTQKRNVSHSRVARRNSLLSRCGQELTQGEISRRNKHSPRRRWGLSDQRSLLRWHTTLRGSLRSQSRCSKKTTQEGSLTRTPFYSLVEFGCGHYEHGQEATLGLRNLVG